MQIIKNSFLYVFSTGLSKGLPFLLLPLLTRFFSVEEFGILGVAMVIVSIFALVIGFNPFLFVIARFHQIGKEKLAIYIYNILAIAFVCSITIAAIYIFFPDIFSAYGIDHAMLWVVLLVAFNRMLLNMGLAILQMEKKALSYLLVNISLSIPTLILIYLFVVVYRVGWEGVLVSELIAGTAISIFIVHQLIKRKYVASGLHWNLIKDITRFSLPLVPHALALWVMNAIDRFFLAEMVDMEAVGLYSTAYMLALGLSLLHESVHRAWQPYFFEYLAKGNLDLKRRMVRYTWMYYAGSIVLFFVYVEVLRVFLPLLVGKEYLAAMEFIPMIVLAYTVLGMYRVIAGYLYHSNRTMILAAITTAAAIVNIIMNYILIPLNGTIGAAQATLIAFVILFIAVKIVVVRTYDMPWIGAFKSANA